jgi:hypothetical protein
LSSVIETVGAFAGLLSLIGVTVLALLVISQAREVRRLKEWAGGAPERDAELKEVSEVVAEERSEELRVLADREERRLRRAGLAQDGFWARLGRSGQVMLVGAAVIALGAIGVLASNSFTGNEAANGGGKKKDATKSKKVAPASVNVGVLNGTGGAETGLAAEYADRLDSDGFKVQGTADAPTTFDQSIVFYRKGREAQARRVGRSIGVEEFGLVTSDISDLIPNTTVTVVIGTDRADTGDLPG